MEDLDIGTCIPQNLHQEKKQQGKVPTTFRGRWNITTKESYFATSIVLVIVMEI